MTKFDRILGEDCEHAEHIIEALVRKIASANRDPLPKAGTDYYLDRAEAIIFAALVEMIASNSGVGIHNCDQGHPTYRFGARGDVKLGDGPERNLLFQTLQKFDPKHHQAICDLTTWDKFCKLVVSAVR